MAFASTKVLALDSVAWVLQYANIARCSFKTPQFLHQTSDISRVYLRSSFKKPKLTEPLEIVGKILRGGNGVLKVRIDISGSATNLRNLSTRREARRTEIARSGSMNNPLSAARCSGRMKMSISEVMLVLWAIFQMCHAPQY
jgi:hypothetical protein